MVSLRMKRTTCCSAVSWALLEVSWYMRRLHHEWLSRASSVPLSLRFSASSSYAVTLRGPVDLGGRVRYLRW